jgi:hypothetical protein
MQIQTHGSMTQDARAMMVLGMTGMSRTRFRHADEAGEATYGQLPIVRESDLAESMLSLPLETRAEIGCDRRKAHLHMKWPFFHSCHSPHRAGT